jgi:hypothetical protein
MALQYANNVGSQLEFGIAEADVNCILKSVSSFPSGISLIDFAIATIANDDNSLTETIKIVLIDRPTRTLTIERGVDDSTPRNWPANSKVEVRISAGFIREFENQVNAYTDTQIAALTSASTTNTTNKAKAAFATAFILS